MSFNDENDAGHRAASIKEGDKPSTDLDSGRCGEHVDRDNRLVPRLARPSRREADAVTGTGAKEDASPQPPWK